MALSEAQINGRFRLLERPAVLPGKCACCGSVDQPVIDFGFDLDFYGVVYLCVGCLGEATSIVADSGRAESQAVPPPSLNTEAIDEYLRTAADANRRLCAVLPAPYFDDVFDVAEEPTDVARNAGEGDADDAGTILSAPSDGPTVDELTLFQGPDDLSGATSNERSSLSL